jgi:hypothetical protein
MKRRKTTAYRSNICNCFVSIPNPKTNQKPIMATNEAGTALVTLGRKTTIAS